MVLFEIVFLISDSTLFQWVCGFFIGMMLAQCTNPMKCDYSLSKRWPHQLDQTWKENSHKRLQTHKHTHTLRIYFPLSLSSLSLSTSLSKLMSIENSLVKRYQNQCKEKTGKKWKEERTKEKCRIMMFWSFHFAYKNLPKSTNKQNVVVFRTNHHFHCVLYLANCVSCNGTKEAETFKMNSSILSAFPLFLIIPSLCLAIFSISLGCFCFCEASLVFVVSFLLLSLWLLAFFSFFFPCHIKKSICLSPGINKYLYEQREKNEPNQNALSMGKAIWNVYNMKSPSYKLELILYGILSDS